MPSVPLFLTGQFQVKASDCINETVELHLRSSTRGAIKVDERRPQSKRCFHCDPKDHS